MTRKNQSLAALAMFAVLCCTGAAQAAAQRTFVSGTGSDANPCSLSAPCRSFAGALVNTLPGGEIYVLDTAGYGAVTITQAVSIVNQTSTAGATATSGSVITINAGANDRIVLRGLTIAGAGTADNGILFNTGGSLTVEDCSISQVLFVGIQFQPTNAADLHVSNTRITSAEGGISVVPLMPSGSGTFKAVLERVATHDIGIAGIGIAGSQSGSSVSIFATVADSITADDSGSGIVAQSATGHAPVNVMVRNSVISNNATGILVTSQQATLFLGHSTLSGNVTALSNSGTLASYGDNNVDGNGSLGSSPSAVAFH